MFDFIFIVFAEVLVFKMGPGPESKYSLKTLY